VTSVSAPTTVPSAWERELADAFEVLLGAPLDAFPTESAYAFHHWSDFMSFEVLDDLVTGGTDLDAVARGELTDGGRYHGEEVPFGWNGWTLDLGRSIWLLEEDAFGPDAFGTSVGAAVRAASTDTGGSSWSISGADLARVLAAHREELDGIDSEEVMPSLLLRIHTDGTLFDTMRAATWTTGGPADLVPLTPGDEAHLTVEPVWEERLGRVPDLRLRNHLRMLCLTAHSARGYGGYYLGPGGCSFDLGEIGDRPGNEAVAGWEFGEGQASSAVFRIGRTG
jgi:hypothetical protein